MTDSLTPELMLDLRELVSNAASCMESKAERISVKPEHLWGVAGEAHAQLEFQAARIAELERENMCDACAGTGKPVSGIQCMCRGTGKMSEAAKYLREQLSQPPNAIEPFVVKHYSGDARPSIKGNGFDGLEIGEDRQDAEDFVRWINERLRAPEPRESVTDLDAGWFQDVIHDLRQDDPDVGLFACITDEQLAQGLASAVSMHFQHAPETGERITSAVLHCSVEGCDSMVLVRAGACQLHPACAPETGEGK